MHIPWKEHRWKGNAPYDPDSAWTSGVNYNDYQLNRRQKEALISGLMAMGFVIGILFYDSIFPCFFLPLAYGPVRKEVERVLCRKRKKLLRAQFRDFLFSISSSFATGRHMAESIEESIPGLSGIYEEDALILKEARYMLRQMQGKGSNETEVLQDFAKRSGLEEVGDFVRVYCACRETGGNLIGAMQQSATLIGEEIEIDDEIAAGIAQRKYEGRIIAVMPAVILAFLRISSPDYLNVMFTTAAGRILMTAALAVTAATIYMIERITEIEI